MVYLVNLKPLQIYKAGDAATEGTQKLPENLPKQKHSKSFPYPVLQISASASHWANSESQRTMESGKSIVQHRVLR